MALRAGCEMQGCCARCCSSRVFQLEQGLGTLLRRRITVAMLGCCLMTAAQSDGCIIFGFSSIYTRASCSAVHISARRHSCSDAGKFDIPNQSNGVLQLAQLMIIMQSDQIRHCRRHCIHFSAVTETGLAVLHAGNRHIACMACERLPYRRTISCRLQPLSPRPWT